MVTTHRISQYVSVEPQGQLADTYRAWRGNRTAEGDQNVHQHAQERLKRGLQRLGLADQVTPHIVAHPSLGWRLVLADEPELTGPEGDHIWPIELEMEGPYETVLHHLERIRSGLGGSLTDCTNVSVAADLPIFLADYWSPAEATAPLFGDRAGAQRMLGVEELHRHPGLTGKSVNVVVVDQGVDEKLVAKLGGRFGGGWEYGSGSGELIRPGQTKGGHGAMMVRNVLDVAPEVTVFDCPMLPPRIANIRQFLSHADAAYARMLADIQYLRERDARWRGPWIFVNAWAIYDRQSEHPLGDYTDNPHHRFNRLVGDVVKADCDVIFCAGNCGQFCPDGRCGATDRGPGHSIYGANSHPSVLTVGAVRVDGLWLGYSSQGPGQQRLAREKPDLCAPAQFAETDDARTSNTGSSASSALVAGVVAALRSRWNAKTIPPNELKQILSASARKTEGDRWDARLGHGVLNAAAAYRAAEHHESGRISNPDV